MRSDDGGRPRRHGAVPAAALTLLLLVNGCGQDEPSTGPSEPAALTQADGVAAPRALDATLHRYLQQQGFTGQVGQTLEVRLGRPIDRRLAALGRLLWFDPITALHDDNACGGCHSPTNGFGDTQSIAIGIDNNGVVGPDRRGPRNQRRAPMAANTAFYPTLMWNSRFRSLSGDPFDNGAGFLFPPPEGRSLSALPHLLAAQAFIPPTERTEAAGFSVPGGHVALRRAVLDRLNASPGYRRLFGRSFAAVAAGGPITFEQFGRAIAEFEFTLTFADAPIDRYARGDAQAMTEPEKRGAILFFGSAGCVACHAVAGQSNEMFSDFEQHVIGVPQVHPTKTNVTFDGPAGDEDFGLEQVTGNSADRYAFRTSPLRNVALQPAFMHDGAFVRLDAAVRHHLDAVASARAYSTAELAPDLQGPPGPIEPVLARLDHRLAVPLRLPDEQVADLVRFVGEALLDPAARPERLRHLVPNDLPSGRAGFTFEFEAFPSRGL
jgi:cytochrome c peroxidase